MTTERYLTYVLFFAWLIIMSFLGAILNQLGLLIGIVAGIIVLIGWLRVLNKELDGIGKD